MRILTTAALVKNRLWEVGGRPTRASADRLPTVFLDRFFSLLPLLETVPFEDASLNVLFSGILQLSSGHLHLPRLTYNFTDATFMTSPQLVH